MARETRRAHGGRAAARPERAGRPRRGSAPPVLRARLLGGLALRLGEEPLPPLDSGRAESLLAFLLLHRDAPQPRDRLAFLLWPDSSEPQARTNLRHLLHTLRRALPAVDGLLEAGPRAIGWREEARCEVDVEAFERALERADAARDGDARLAALAEAASLYAGELLPGSWEDWLLDERERLRERHRDALERLVPLLEERGRLDEAVRHAERLLRDDPLREEPYRALMRLHHARGDRARALRAYHQCAATLERELGVEPSAATRAAYEALLPEPSVERPAPPGRTPLVGRAAEWARLLDLWRACERGRAALALVAGEPGIGKSRLVEELRAACEHRGVPVAEARSYPAEGPLAYGPVVAWLRARPLAEARGRVDPARRAELARVLPELVGEEGVPPPPPLPEDEQRRRLFDALAAAVLAPARPSLLVLDDAHWCDRETLRFLHYLLRARPDAPLLVAATARPEEVDAAHPLAELAASLRAAGALEELELGRLGREETAALAERVAGRRLEGDEAARLHAETEGSPLYVVEAMRAGWGTPEEPPGPPPRVQAVIESRLARLGPSARELAAAAAAVGGAFTAELLAGVSGLDDAAVVEGLDELWRRRVVRERGADSYELGHDRIREVAYAALGPAARRRLHLRAARTLERLHGADPAAVSAQVAGHLERGGAAAEAAAWYARAAVDAQRVYAAHDAIRLAERGLELARSLPAGRGRDERELGLVLALLVPLGSLEGLGSVRLGEAQRRGLELAGVLGAEPAPLLASTALSRLTLGRFEEAEALGARLRARADADRDDGLLAEAEYVLGIAAFWRGRLEEARARFESAVERSARGPRLAGEVVAWLDPGVVCLSRLANTLWLLGRPRSAVRARDAALALAAERRHPESVATALVFAALLALELRDEELLRRHVAEVAAWRARHESRVLGLSAEAWGALVGLLDGRRKDGVARIRRVLETGSGTGHAPGFRGYVTRLLLEACALAGEPAEGLAAADAWLAGDAGEALWEAEVRRLRAGFLAALGGDPGEVDAELVRALDVARRQGALAFELRAAAALLAHRRDTARPGVDEARQRLGAVLASLPERTRTAERREAEALLRRA